MTAETRFYTADRIFTGDEWLASSVVKVADGRIDGVIPVSEIPSSARVQAYDGCVIIPAFIDAQIYGASGKLFAQYPEEGSLHALVQYCREGGAVHCLPTVATNKTEVFYSCIDVIRKYWNKNGKGVLGLHIEGPWISRAKRGAHIESLVSTPDPGEVRTLLEYGKGVIKMITLAPEVCSPGIIDLIRSYGVVISAGHSDASYEDAMKAFDNGVDAVTHLFNAMSPLHHRKPGLVGAAMDHDQVMASIIPDGYHVHFAAIRIAARVMKGRLFAITDAVTETTSGFYQHHAVKGYYESGGVLSGSALNMNVVLKNLVRNSGIDFDEAVRMCSLYPAKLLKMEQEFGRISEGYRTSLLVLDENLNVVTIEDP